MALKRLEEQEENRRTLDPQLTDLIRDAVAESVIGRFETYHDCTCTVLKRYLREKLGIPSMPNRTIDITAEERVTVLALLRKHLPHARASADGSCVKQTSHPASDLDLMVFATPDHGLAVSELREALKESGVNKKMEARDVSIPRPRELGAGLGKTRLPGVISTLTKPQGVRTFVTNLSCSFGSGRASGPTSMRRTAKNSRLSGTT